MNYLVLGLALVALCIVVTRRKGVERGPEPLWIGMVGVTGTADNTFTTEGTVTVNGEIWKATSRKGIIQRGETVRVLSINPGLVLEVEADQPPAKERN
ncbi:MAG: NfeD-like C-terminal, partner-binding [Pseudomonadota bacterium]